MNTNAIKSFAKVARINLLKSAYNQLFFWGFDEKGNVVEQPIELGGGFTFRGSTYNDTTIIPKWNKLKAKLAHSKESFKDVAEEAAYTWFNRLVAIRILEKNGFIDPVIAFQENTLVPAILQQAKAGNHSITHSGDKANLHEALLKNNDERAFALLIIHYCNQHPLLKEIFGHVNDYTEILIPQDLLAKDGLLAMLNDEDSIPSGDFQEVELIGWLYQFYISDRKDEVFKGFKANKKARPEDIPAATQIFTPKWIVDYMVENTVGKIYLDYEEDSALKNQMKYWVENQSETKDNLIDDITQLSLIDPACGSGHILVTGFEWLYKMYREQGYGAKQAIESILKNNLYGLDLDDRAMQLARFAVLLKAAQELDKTANGEGKKLLNQALEIMPHIYAFPETHGFVTEEIAVFTGNQYVEEIYPVIDLLRQGKNIGSALKLSLSDEARKVLETQYQNWKQRYNAGTLDLANQAIWENLKTYVEVALVLTQQYAAVVANPPYMGQKSMNGELKNYVNQHYPMTKADLMTVFMEVIPNLTKDKYRFALINLPSWLFLSTFENMRKFYLDNYQIDSLLHMGRGIFGIDFGSVAFAIKKEHKENAVGSYFRLHERNFQHIYFEDIEKLFLYSNGNVDYKYDFSLYRDEEGVSEIPEKGTETGQKLFYSKIPQTNFDKIPGSPIAYWASYLILKCFVENDSLFDHAPTKVGQNTGDNERFLKFWYEVNCTNVRYDLKEQSNLDVEKYKWLPYRKGGDFRRWYGNIQIVVNWIGNGKLIKEYAVIRNNGKHWSRYIQNLDYNLKSGFSWSFIGANGIGVRLANEGQLFDVQGSSGFPIKRENLYYCLGLLNSKFTTKVLEIINPTLSFQTGNLAKVPFKVGETERVDNLSQTNVQISKKDWDSRETSWDFVANPLLAQHQDSLKEAYQLWQEDVTKDFFQLHANEEELNRIFIDIYGLQEELTPEVALKDITILQDELKAADLEALETAFRAGESVNLPIQQDVVISQLLSYMVGCMLGRYRLDCGGLHIAHPNPTEEELANYSVENYATTFQMQIDDDAIIPLLGSAGAFPDDAVKRTEDLLHKLFGEESHTKNLNFIDEALGMKLEKWMTEKFWLHHISGTMYKKKPIYWLFCSNPKKPQNAAFRVLVYMHRMDAFTVQKIMRNYLHPHQEHLRSQYETMQENEVNLSKQELKSFENIQKQISELKEYNEVLKALADQQITFDLDDGVTVNYAKFKDAVAEIK